MARIVRIFHQFFEVVRQADRVKFEQSVVHVQARRMHIPVDDSVLVEMAHS